jgi:formate-dependent nitrite reductase membrane component NrfD
MLESTHWGLPIIGYFFLAGLGAGAYTVSASVLLRGGAGGFGHQHFKLARYGALLAPLPVIIGTGLLVLELGSFEAGNYFKFIYLFTTINLSPMSIGSWLLNLFILASLVYAFTFWAGDSKPGDQWDVLRRRLAWIGVPLGIAVAVYTGVLLGAMPARPFWNSPILAMLFMISSLSTGVAGILLLQALFSSSDHEPGHEHSEYVPEGAYMLAASDAMLIGFELLVIFLFIMFAHLTVGNVKEAFSVILFGGSLANLFWFGVVILGLLLPVLIELRYVLPKLLYHHKYTAPRGVELLVPVIVLIGGFLLRYVVVMAGQITGPVGI